MISIGQTVYAILKSTGVPVWYFHPKSWVQLPTLSWHESQNRELSQADGREHLAQLEYTVDVWARSPEQVHELADRVDEKLTAVRLRRDFSQMLYEASTGIYHCRLRYRCAADGKGNIYQ